MKYHLIPGTDYRFSAVSLGTDGLVGRMTEEEIFALFDRYVELGGNILDTALIYSYDQAEHSSNIEKVIGRWIKSRSLKGKVFVATKGAHYIPINDTKPRLAAADITKDLESSLRSLGTDCIDLYWLHRDDPQRPAEDIIETMNRLKLAGKIKHYACSNWRGVRITEANEIASKKGTEGFVANQMAWSLANPNPDAPSGYGLVWMDKTEKSFHEKTEMPAMPYSSQAKGFFSKMEAAAETGEKIKSRYYNSDNLNILGRLKEISVKTGAPVSQLVLAWLMGQPFTTIPIVGCKNIAQLEDSMGASEISLDRETVRYISDF